MALVSSSSLLRPWNLVTIFAVAGDQEAAGVAEDAAEFVSGFVSSEKDGIVHREFLPVDVEAFLVEKRRNDGLALFNP